MKLLKFDKKTVERLLLKEVKGWEKILTNTINRMEAMGHFKDLSRSTKKVRFGSYNWYEGKNYNWLAFRVKKGKDTISGLIRQYGSHFTFWTNFKEYKRLSDGFEYHDNSRAVFTLNAMQEHMDGGLSDFYVDYPETILNELFLPAMDLIREENLWRTCYLSKEKYFKGQHVFGRNGIYFYDDFIFAMEELTLINRDTYCEWDMTNTLKKWKDQNIDLTKFELFRELYRGATKIKGFKVDTTGYHHGTGLKLSYEGKEKWEDVYSLAEWSADGWHKLVKEVEDSLK